jgi:predicted nucleic acid-binding protein
VNRVVIDTGPLVALLNSRDAFHDWSRDVFAEITPPLLTCESVLSETCFLLRKTNRGPDVALELLDRGVIALSFSLADETRAVRQLMRRYASVSMSLADACLVRMTELDARATLLTLDSDFATYRRNGRQRIPLIRPDT